MTKPALQARTQQRRDAKASSQRAKKTHASAIETMRLTDRQWGLVLETIRETQRHAPDNRRAHTRDEGVDLARIVIEIDQPGGTKNTLLANAYDLSESGLGMIHGRYLYPGCACVCWLPHAAEGMKPLAGEVRWCKHITGTAHMSGVEFEQAINAFDYMPGKLTA